MEFNEYKQKVIEQIENMDDWIKVVLDREVNEDNCQTIEYAFSRGFTVNDAAAFVFYGVQDDELEHCPNEDIRNVLTEDYCLKRSAIIQEKYSCSDAKKF